VAKLTVPLHPQEDKEAVKWYTKSAEQGLAQAQFNLGVRYDNGQGVPQDYKEAVKWYRKAAEQGDAKAQYFVRVFWSNETGHFNERKYLSIIEM